MPTECGGGNERGKRKEAGGIRPYRLVKVAGEKKKARLDDGGRVEIIPLNPWENPFNRKELGSPLQPNCRRMGTAK